MASLPSNLNVSRQLPLTSTDQWPTRSPRKECRRQPGAFMSWGRTALSRAKSCLRSLSACFGWIPPFEPFLKNCSMPRCRKLLIIALVYSQTIQSVNSFLWVLTPRGFPRHVAAEMRRYRLPFPHNFRCSNGLRGFRAGRPVAMRSRRFRQSMPSSSMLAVGNWTVRSV